MQVQKQLQQAKNILNENKTFFKKLKRKTPTDLDDTVQELHEEVFSQVDCLECANCCKTTSPIFRDKDIERIAKHLRSSPSAFIEKYLHMDEDKDYVLNQSPCAFLGADNYCSIYEYRPAACREYPHTNRKRFHQVLELTLKNSVICPAVYQIIERMKIKLNA